MNRYLPLFVAVLLMMLLTAQHVFIAYDSRDFLAASRSLRAGHGYLMADGRPFTMWPPLYPALLALFRNPVPAARWMNILWAGLAVGLAGTWLLRRGLSPFVSAAIPLISLAVPTYLTAAQSILTEQLYLVFVLAFLLTVESITTRRGLLLSALLAALAISQRHMGAVLLGVGSIEMLLCHQPKRLTRWALFILPSLLVVLIWGMHNAQACGAFDGCRSGPDHSLWENIRATGHVLWTLRGAVELVVLMVIGEEWGYAALAAVRRSVAAHAQSERQRHAGGYSVPAVVVPGGSAVLTDRGESGSSAPKLS